MQKDFLESFIGMLSTSEKHYISEHLSVRNKENNFSALFNMVAIGRKNSVIENLKKENINTYRVTKSQLKDKIFKLLRMYHSDTSREQAMKNICMDVEILYQKGAFSHCRDLIARALINCKKNEWFELELYLLSWKEKVLIATFHMADMEKELHANQKRQKEVYAQLINNHYHRTFMYEVFLIQKKIGFPKNPSEAAVLHKVIRQYEKGDAENISSYRARIWHYLVYIYYYFVLKDYSLCYPYAQKLVKTVESFERASGISQSEFLYIARQNVMVCEVYLKKYAKLQESLRKIRAIKFNSKREKANVFAHSHVIETDMYIHLADFSKIADILPTLEEGLKIYEELINKEQRMVLYSNVSYLYFGCAQYRLVLQWNNKILNNYAKNVREDIYTFAYILNLIAHYELDNYALLESLLLSTYRYLYKKKRVFEIETIILTFIKYQLNHKTPPEKTKESLRQLLSDIEQLCANNKTEKVALEYFDFISWLESKIQNRSFAEIVREKATQS